MTQSHYGFTTFNCCSYYGFYEQMRFVPSLFVVLENNRTKITENIKKTHNNTHTTRSLSLNTIHFPIIQTVRNKKNHISNY